MKSWIFRSRMFISWKLSEMGGLGDRVCEPKQRCSPPRAQTKLQTAQHFRPYAAYELAPESCLARFLWMLLIIKLKKKAQPQQAKSYTQPGCTICRRGIYTLNKFLYMYSLSAFFSSSSSLKYKLTLCNLILYKKVNLDLLLHQNPPNLPHKTCKKRAKEALLGGKHCSHHA